MNEEILEQEKQKEEAKENIEEQVKDSVVPENNVKEEKEESKIIAEETKKQDKEKKKKSGKKKFIIIFIIILLLLVLLVPSIVFSVININNKNMFDGVKIEGIDISNMTIEEAKSLISENVDEKVNINLSFVNNEYEINLTPEKAGIKFDVDSAIDEAYKIGREGNIISNDIDVLQTKINGKEIEIEISVDQDKFNNVINEINANLPNGIIQPGYYINEKELIITSGKEGNAVNEEEFKKILITKMNTPINNDEKIEIPVKIAKQKNIDLDAIHSEIYKEAKNAYVTKDPFEIYTHVDGVDFETSVEEAKQLLNEPKEEYKIPLKITSPEITIDKLGEEAFPVVLATYSTNYPTSNVGRSTNVELATSKMNGVVLMPGEEFSYNKTIGATTPEAGYQLGAAYVAGKVVNEYGGGVCQPSTTLYNAVLLSNLEVTSRANHYYPVSYAPIGRDATVYWPSLDFKFKNNRKYPIKIRTTAGGGTVKIDILGTKEETDYDIELESYVVGYTAVKTEYKDDNTLPVGKEIVEEFGSNGTVSETYKILKKDGNVVSKEFVSRDTYNGYTRVVRRGTKKEVAKPANSNVTVNPNYKNETQNNNKKQENANTNKKNTN